MNSVIERVWSQFKKSIVGQRFGQAYLGGRRCPSSTEFPDFIKACAQEMKDIFENNVTVRREGGEVVPPHVEYVPPMSEEQVNKVMFHRAFLLATSQKVVDSSPYLEMRQFVRGWNQRTTQTLNALLLYGKDLNREQTFGPTQTLPQPEEWVAPDGSKHFASYLQLKEKYKDARQTTALVPPVQGKEVVLMCCDRVFRYHAQFDRHSRWMHFGRRHGAKRKRAGENSRTPKRKLSDNRDATGDGDLEEDIHEQDQQEAADESEDDEDDIEQHEAEKIVGKTYLRGELHYIVRWKGFGPKDDTTEPLENLTQCSGLVEEFERHEQEMATMRAAGLGLRTRRNG